MVRLSDTPKKRAQAPRKRGSLWVILSPALVFTSLFFAVPLLVMLVYSTYQRVGLETVTTPSLTNYLTFFSRPYFLTALQNSLEVTLTVTLVSLLVAYPLAYILAYRVPRRWQRLALVLAILPFWTSYVVRSYSWLLVLSSNGMLSKTLLRLGLIGEPVSFVNSRTGTVIGFVHFFAMLLTLTIFANLVQISPNYRKAAADLGASWWQTFRRVTLPLSVPGIMVGAFLTFVLCIGDYITPEILGGGQELLLPQAIILQIGRRADFPMASAMSMVLMVIITLAFVASARWLRLERI